MDLVLQALPDEIGQGHFFHVPLRVLIILEKSAYKWKIHPYIAT